MPLHTRGINIALLCFVFVVVSVLSLLWPYNHTIRYKSLIQTHPELKIRIRDFKPLVENLPEFLKSVKQERIFEDYCESVRMGFDAELSYFGPKARLALFDVDMVSDVLSKQSHMYRKTDLSHRILDRVVGESMVALEGDAWTRRREQMVPAFKGTMLKKYSEIMSRNIEELARGWNERKHPFEVDVFEEMKLLTLKIIAGVAFGDNSFDEDTEDGNVAAEELASLTSDLLLNAIDYGRALLHMVPGLAKAPTAMFRTVVRNKSECERRLNKIILERERKNAANALAEEKDLLDFILKDENNAGLSRQAIQDELLLWVIAGHETTSARLLAWTFKELGEHTDVLDTCREEIDVVLGSTVDTATKPTYDSIKQMPFMHGVLLEALRLHPPVAVVLRTAVREHKIGNGAVPISKGLDVVVPIYAIHRSPKYYKNPLTFEPNRFLEDEVDEKNIDESPSSRRIRLPKHGDFLPFSKGKRLCPGQRFALAEARLVLATLLPLFEFDLLPHQKFVMAGKGSAGPKYGVRIRVSKRDDRNVDETSESTRPGS